MMREHAGPQADHRRRPARLLQGSGRAVQAYERFLETIPNSEKVFLLQIAPLCRDDVEPTRISGPRWKHCRAASTAPSPTSTGCRSAMSTGYPARRAGGYLPRRVDRPGDAAAGRYEPRGERICGRAGSGRSWRVDPVGLAGAAAQMTAALIVNPFSREDMAEAMRRALVMPIEERRARWSALNDGVQRDHVGAWRDGFVGALEKSSHRPPPLKVACGA